MYDVLLSFITSFTLTFVAIPSIINVARVKHLMDEPENITLIRIAFTLGGIGNLCWGYFSIVYGLLLGCFRIYSTSYVHL